MKILFISPVPTDPCTAGNRARISTLTNAIRELGHTVHFAYIPMEDADLPAMQTRFGSSAFHQIAWTTQEEGAIKNIVRKAGRFLNSGAAFTYRLDAWFDTNANESLRKLNDLHHFDAVIVEYVFMSRAFEAFPDRTLKILDTHDSFGMRYKHYLDSGMRPRWFSTTLAEEEQGFRRANVVLAIQDIETNFFATRIAGSSTEVIQVGHLIDIPPLAIPSEHEAAVFLGSDNPINVVGARYFIDRVLPLVRRRKPSFEVKLAGSVSNEIEAQDGVVKLGFLKNLQDAFDSAMLSINPVLAGTGINIKLLDAMAAGMPIVTTQTGARGLEHFGQNAFFSVADQSPDAFADRILKLLDDRGLRKTLSAGSRSAAEEWNKSQISSMASILKIGNQ